MIIGFPNRLQGFYVTKPVARAQALVHAHYVGYALARDIVLTAPIDIRIGDQVLIDLQTNTLQMINRRGVTIWRVGCLN